MRIKQIKNIIEQDDSIKYAIATNLAKYGRPDSRPGDKKSKLTKGLEKKREKHVLDLKKSMDENQEAEKAIRDTLSKEGGAAGLKPLVKAVKKFGINKEELVKLLKKITKVKKHRDGDYILTPINEKAINTNTIKVSAFDLNVIKTIHSINIENTGSIFFIELNVIAPSSVEPASRYPTDGNCF